MAERGFAKALRAQAHAVRHIGMCWCSGNRVSSRPHCHGGGIRFRAPAYRAAGPAVEAPRSCRSGSDGVNKLSFGVGGSRIRLLRIRVWSIGARGIGGSSRYWHPALYPAGEDEQPLAPAFPVRPVRVALAIAYLRVPATDETLAIIVRYDSTA